MLEGERPRLKTKQTIDRYERRSREREQSGSWKAV
jgi:hypothetical protein